MLTLRSWIHVTILLWLCLNHANASKKSARGKASKGAAKTTAKKAAAKKTAKAK